MRRLAAAASILLLAAPAMCAVELFVATGGNDDNPGTAEEPFATLEAARDAIRQLKRTRGLGTGARVRVGDGTYYRDKPFELTEEDSGTEDVPVIYTAQMDGGVTLSGGRPVSGFGPVTDEAVLERLRPDVRGHVVQADLRAQGITNFGEMSRRGFVWPKRDSGLEVFFRSKPMTLARWPNEVFLHIASVPDGQDGGAFTYEGDEPAGWTDEPDVWVHGYWTQDWADSYEKVAAIDAERRVVRTEPPHGVYGYTEGQRFYFLNVLAELDRPGEWYLDRESGILYLWPPSPIRDGDVVVSVIPTLLSLKDTSNVAVIGMTLEAVRGTAVTISGGANSGVRMSRIRNTGRQGISISGGTGNVVATCDIYDTGEGAISVDGGDRASLTPAGHMVEENLVHHFGRLCRTYSAGVHVSGVGQRVEHNLIHNGPHVGILLGGNDHLIEKNELHSLCWETGDVGAFYMGRDWTARGTVIRHNFFHHIRGPGKYGANGIYLDDAASGITIFGNVFFQVTRAAYIGGGRDVTYENNLFVDCVPWLHVDARAMGWMAYHAAEDGTLQERLRAVPYKEPPWSERYPELVNILEDEPAAPKGNRIVRNVIRGGAWDDIEEVARPYLTIEDNLVEAPQRPVPAGGMTFQLPDDSPAYALGFQRIPFEEIGLRDNLERRWPVEHSVHPYSAVPVEPPEPPPPKREPRLRTGPPPVYPVALTDAGVAVDADLTPDEGAAILIEQGVDGWEVEPVSRAWLRHDGEALLVAFENRVKESKPLRTGNDWGADDAVEVALRVEGVEDGPILVLRGYPSGHFESSDEAGAPAEAVARAAEGVEYAARVVGDGVWEAEWRIPFASLGFDPTAHRRLACNLTVRKTADPLWVMWQGTGRWSWEVDKAGVLEIEDLP